MQSHEILLLSSLLPVEIFPEYIIYTYKEPFSSTMFLFTFRSKNESISGFAKFLLPFCV